MNGFFSELEQAILVKQVLDAQDVGYRGQVQFDSRVTHQPFPISTVELSALQERGRHFKRWIDITNRLYGQSLADPALAWVRDLVEVSSPAEVVDLNRRVFRSGRLHAPMFARADQPTLDKAVELQIPGSGWGYFVALTRAYNCMGLNCRNILHGMKLHLEDYLGTSKPKVIHLLHKSDRFGKEADYFARMAREAGIDFQLSVQQIPHDIDSYDLVIRHYLEELVQYPGWEHMIDLYLDGKIEIEPPPNLITDQKVNTMFPYHPQTRQWYDDEIRSLFPTTYLVQEGAEYLFEFDGEQRFFTNRDIVALGNKQRRFVVKYAGLDPARRSGGREVWSMYKMTSSRAVELLNMAAKDYAENGQPWLIQEMIRQKYDYQYLDLDKSRLVDEQGCARFMPFFAFSPNGHVPQVLSMAVNFRNFWKVHSQADAVMTLVNIQ